MIIWNGRWMFKIRVTELELDLEGVRRVWACG